MNESRRPKRHGCLPRGHRREGGSGVFRPARRSSRGSCGSVKPSSTGIARSEIKTSGLHFSKSFNASSLEPPPPLRHETASALCRGSPAYGIVVHHEHADAPELRDVRRVRGKDIQLSGRRLNLSRVAAVFRFCRERYAHVNTAPRPSPSLFDPDRSAVKLRKMPDDRKNHAQSAVNRTVDNRPAGSARNIRQELLADTGCRCLSQLSRVRPHLFNVTSMAPPAGVNLTAFEIRSIRFAAGGRGRRSPIRPRRHPGLSSRFLSRLSRAAEYLWRARTTGTGSSRFDLICSLPVLCAKHPVCRDKRRLRAGVSLSIIAMAPRSISRPGPFLY